MQRHIAVIGAGVAGLTCAWRLVRLGYRVTVWEAAPRLGGLLWQWHEDGPCAWPSGATTLGRLLRAGALEGAVLRRAAVFAEEGGKGNCAIPSRREEAKSASPVVPLSAWAWWRSGWQLARWGRRHPQAALAEGIVRLDPTIGRFWETMLWRISGETSASLTFARAEAIIRWLRWHGVRSAQLMRLSSAFIAKMGGIAPAIAEWFAVALARRLGRRGVAVQVAAKVDAVLGYGSGWKVRTGATSAELDAVVLAIPPQAAAKLIAAELLAEHLAAWPLTERWGRKLPVPASIHQAVMPQRHLWLCGEWLLPAGSFPGMEGAAASGWLTAAAVHRNLTR